MVHNEEIIAAGMLNAFDGVVASPIDLSDQEFSNLMEFLNILTDPKALDRQNEMPRKVPSHLPLINYTDLIPYCSKRFSAVNYGNDF